MQIGKRERSSIKNFSSTHLIPAARMYVALTYPLTQLTLVYTCTDIQENGSPGPQDTHTHSLSLSLSVNQGFHQSPFPERSHSDMGNTKTKKEKKKIEREGIQAPENMGRRKE
jgi:hypothetical protein